MDLKIGTCLAGVLFPVVSPVVTRERKGVALSRRF
jgi:hypothetical protein